MKLNCRKCAADIPAKNINVKQILAVCAQCDRLFDFSPELSWYRKQNRARMFAPRPKDMKVLRLPHHISIQYRWFGLRQIPRLLLQVGLTCMFIFTALNSGQTFFVGAVCFFLFALIASYSLLAVLFNSTKFEIGPKKVCVSYGPVPWFGNMELNRADMLQIYGKEVKVGSKNQLRLYEVHAIRQDKANERMAIFPSPDHALFIESVIETFWNIEDIPVRGEIAR